MEIQSQEILEEMQRRFPLETNFCVLVIEKRKLEEELKALKNG
jgi:hypothetical protein